MHTHIHTFIDARKCTHSISNARVHIGSYYATRKHTYTDMFSLSHTCKLGYKHVNTATLSCTHIHSHTNIRNDMYLHINTLFVELNTYVLQVEHISHVRTFHASTHLYIIHLIYTSYTSSMHIIFHICIVYTHTIYHLHNSYSV